MPLLNLLLLKPTNISQMRATNDRLSEKYILVVARELAKALKGLHEAGIMHRDVKGRFCCYDLSAFLAPSGSDANIHHFS